MSAVSYLLPADGGLTLAPVSIDPAKEHRARVPLRIPPNIKVVLGLALQRNDSDFVMGSDYRPAGLVS
jgi:hypothetical protein